MFLKNRNFISKIRRSKVTDYAALIQVKSIADSAILSTCIKLPSVFKSFVLCIFERLLKTGFTVVGVKHWNIKERCCKITIWQCIRLLSNLNNYNNKEEFLSYTSNRDQSALRH